MTNVFPIAVLLLVLFSFSVNAQPPKIGVAVNVTAGNTIKGEIESYIKRELRALNDIDLYSIDPDYEISLVAIEPGEIVAISVLVVSKTDYTKFINRNLSSKNIDSKTREDLIQTLGTKKLVESHSLASNSVHRLAELCKSIVGDIDVSVFEPEREVRKIFYEAEELLKRSSARSNSRQNGIPPRATTQGKTDDQPVFERRYVGGDGPPQITVINDANISLTLTFDGRKYIIPSGQTRTIQTSDGGRFSFLASAPGVRSLSGEENFDRGYVYSWRFDIRKAR